MRTTPKTFAGTWRITESEVWDEDALDMVVPAHITFAAESRSMRGGSSRSAMPAALALAPRVLVRHLGRADSPRAALDAVDEDEHRRHLLERRLERIAQR